MECGFQRRFPGIVGWELILRGPQTFSRDSRIATFVRNFFTVPPLDLTRGLSVYSLVGLSLLYASAYFLAWLIPPGSYLLPSNDYFGLVVVPAAEAIAISIVSLFVVTSAFRRWSDPRFATVCSVFAVCVLILIALKGIMYAAGYDWADRIPHVGNMVIAQRIFKITLTILLIGVVWVARGVIPVLNRALASLGFAFLMLALIQIAFHSHVAAQAAPSPVSMAAGPLHPLVARAATSDIRPRRVVWVIFDETDFGRLFGSDKLPGLEVPNYDFLAHAAVFATHANSPAKATLFSIPALLTGSPIGGAGVQLDRNGDLFLERAEGGRIPFSEATGLFGAVSAGGLSVSALGFFHPYCKLFFMQKCDSLTWPQVGSVGDVLRSNVPGILLTRLGFPNYWDVTTERGIELLPQYLVRDDALTFVHLNLPHPPATYAEKTLHVLASSDPLVSYSHNLLLSDKVLGGILQTLREQSARHELLLVVSTDHWLRKLWYRPNEPESSRPVPFIMWRVGSTDGVVLSQPLSTVHTAEMILSYLNGEISSQPEIARWWADRPVFPSFLEPAT